MFCPKCNVKAKVISGVWIKDASEYYRKRVCPKCGKVFYTTEFEIENTKTFRQEWGKYREGG